MPAKITLTGKRVSAITTTKDYHRFDMKETGSPSAPKGLPLAQATLFNVFVGIKAGKKINILNLPDNQIFLIMGEITMDLPKKISPGQIGVIAFNVQLIEHKEKNLSSNEEFTTSGDQNVLPVNIVDISSPIYETNLIEKAHSLYHGLCTDCTAMMDKRVAKIRLINEKLPPNANNLLLLCPDCFKHRKNPAFDVLLIGPRAKVKFENLGMDQSAINEFLSGFIDKFVLIHLVEYLDMREYWVPNKHSIFKFKTVGNIIVDLTIFKQ